MVRTTGLVYGANQDLLIKNKAVPYSTGCILHVIIIFLFLDLPFWHPFLSFFFYSLSLSLSPVSSQINNAALTSSPSVLVCYISAQIYSFCCHYRQNLGFLWCYRYGYHTYCLTLQVLHPVAGSASQKSPSTLKVPFNCLWLRGCF